MGRSLGTEERETIPPVSFVDLSREGEQGFEPLIKYFAKAYRIVLCEEKFDVRIHQGDFWESRSESLRVKGIAEIAFYFDARRLLGIKQRPEDGAFKIFVPAALGLPLI